MIVRNVSTNFGESFSRLSIFRLFSRCGKVTDVQLRGNCCWVTYSASSEAQEAMVQLDGYSMFASDISVSIAEPLGFGLQGWRYCSEETPAVFFDGADASWVKIALRHVKGFVESIDVGENKCIARFENSQCAAIHREHFDGRYHPTGGQMVVSFIVHQQVH